MKSIPATLSSPWTPFWKLFPLLIWLLFLAGATYSYAIRDADEFVPRAAICLLSTPFLGIMFFRYRRLLDHVEIVAGELLLRRRGAEVRVPLADVLSVNPGIPNIPTLVSLRLRDAVPFGDEVRFAARLPVEKWTSTRLLAVESLISAVDAAKLERRT